MRVNQPVTQREATFSPDQRIVSTTDTHGVITYANADFIAISGFTEAELIGQGQNIVRHPDIPPVAFAELWRTLKAGKPWMGVVKNRCKNGDHYWVDAFVTPMVTDGKITGYQSVRGKPTPESVARAEKAYRQLWRPPSFWQRCLRWRPQLQGKCFLVGGLPLLAAALISPWLGVWPATAIAALMLAIGARALAAPWQQAAAAAREQFASELSKAAYSGRSDELGDLLLAAKFQCATLDTVVWRIADSVSLLQSAVDSSTTAAQRVSNQMDAEKAELERVATAMHQMTVTIHEVARQTTEAASATHVVDQQIRQGDQEVTATIKLINQLAERMERASAVMTELENASSGIGSVVEVIRAIAEQTNLLALNAAIEAARAGEQGRGFAVVADEVRTLASRTQGATSEIQEMVAQLQQRAQSAAQVISDGHQDIQQGVSQGQQASQALQESTQSADRITAMVTQMATAAEQQGAVAEEINQSVVNIDHTASSTLASARQCSDGNEQVSQLALRLHQLVLQFGTQK